MGQSREHGPSEEISLIKAESLRHKAEIDAGVKKAREQLDTSRALLAQLDSILQAWKTSRSPSA